MALQAGKEVRMKDRIIRLGLDELELTLRENGQIESEEWLHDAHIEPNELVIRIYGKESGDENGNSKL